MRATATAACRTNGPSCWLLQGHALTLEEHEQQCVDQIRHSTAADIDDGSPTDRETPGTGQGGESGWVDLHRVEGGNQGAVGRLTGWDYDTEVYKAGEVPGETRFYDVPVGGAREQAFARFRWIFFGRPLPKQSVEGDQGDQQKEGKEEATTTRGSAKEEEKEEEEEDGHDAGQNALVCRPLCSVQISALRIYKSSGSASSD